MKEELEKLILKALESVGIKSGEFVVEHPSDKKLGDYSTNVGIKYRDHKEEIIKFLSQNGPIEIDHIDVAGPGFINFYLSKDFFAQSLKDIIKKGEDFGRRKKLSKQKVMVEYTDPNPFKEFHIGHLMSNAIGEAVSRIIEWNGAEVRRANYQGDTGMHVAKAIWGYFHGDWQGAYVVGARAYDEDMDARKEIEEINKKIFNKSDETINKVYEEGKKESLKQFEKIYKRLGTKFDFYFFESEAGHIGEKLVKKNIGRIFEESDGAVVFHAEKHDPSLHTRVFINRHDLPTYEAKDLGNAVQKYEKYKYTQSVVVTGNEIKEYFRVMLSALAQIEPKLAEVTKHLPHGMLRLPTGKMSSRTGEIITAETLIDDVKKKTKDNEEVAIAAIKYMILRQSIGNDIIFDIDKSVSTLGDSGVYLQYAHARAHSILAKVGKKGRIVKEEGEVREIEKLLYRFPEIIERAQIEYAPHHITTYLTELAGAFNNFYAHEQVIEEGKASPYRLSIVEAFRIVMRNGLNILGIPAPERM